MKNTKLLVSVISGLVVASTFVTPAFAGDDKNDDMMHHDQMNHSDNHMSNDEGSSEHNWWSKGWNKEWRKTFNWQMRDDSSDRNLSADMRGSNEVPGPGDSDANGKAQVKVKPRKGEVCVDMWVKNIDAATPAHVHKGGSGVAGPVVVSLPTPNAEGYTNGCVSVSSDVLKDMKKNASEYYVNVHNAAYPDGALRGQLHN